MNGTAHKEDKTRSASKPEDSSPDVTEGQVSTGRSNQEPTAEEQVGGDPGRIK